jgi:signal transduction histidine kinase/ligand-binding sensor domain-containing protein/AraC-like DNA-binding protein/CheY-like chemotaxis protein
VGYKIIIFFLVGLPGLGLAQSHSLNFKNFSSKDGLSSNIVNAILKDRFGYMWFATDDGLNRFDGTSFTVYNYNAADTFSICANHVLALCEDPSGNLWVGTNKGLSLYDRQRDVFHNYDVAKGTPVRSICSDRQGDLWLGGYLGLVRFHPGSGKWKSYTAQKGGPGGLMSNTVTCVFADSKKRLWIGSNNGLFLYQPGTDDFRGFSRDSSASSIGANAIIKTITEDQEGRIWVGTNDSGLTVLTPGSMACTCFKSTASQPNTLSSNRIICMAQDSTGRLWVGTENGLNILDPQSGNVERIPSDIRNKYSLKGKSVRSIYIDKNGIYWVAAFQSGVNKYDNNLAFFQLVQSNPFDISGLSAPKVTSFAEAGNGDLYVGTDGGGVSIYHPRTNLFEHLSIGQQPLTVMALERVGNELWIGTYLQGIYVLNTSSKRVRHYTKGDSPQGLSSDEIFCLRKDHHGNIWIGTNGKGIDIYNIASGTFQRLNRYTVDANGNKHGVGGFIRAIEVDSLDNIWIGTNGTGLAVYNQQLRSLQLYNRENFGQPLDDVQALLPGKNIVWVGTGGNGLFRLDTRDNSFSCFSGQQGLANPVIYKILEDGEGKLWMSTNKGISSFEPGSATFKNFTAYNGLQGSAFSLGAGLRTAGGELFFGGLEGFNYFLPATLHYNRNIPKVVFTDLRVANQPVKPGRHSPIREPMQMAREIHLDYKQNFSIDFTALDYTNPHECRYMYRLEGFDKSWNHIGTARTAVFTNLDPGKYNLQVKACNANGFWTTGAATITIYIKPPFWRTTYAYILYVIIIGAILWGARYRAIRKLEKKFAAEQERRRIRQLVEEERMQAERQRAFDQAKIKFLTNLSHEFRTPVSLIAGPVETLLEKETNKEKLGQLAMVKRNARRLLNLVNQLLDFRKLEEQELKLNVSPGEMVSFVHEVVESFRDLAERRQIGLMFTSSVESYHTVFDRDKIERILFNLLSNAFKFTGRDGQVLLNIRQETGREELVISLADTGKGMPPEELQQIFDRFFQGETHIDVMNQGSGIGLSITKEFVRLHGGSIDVESTYGKGSTFTVRLPLQKLVPQAEPVTAAEPLPPGIQESAAEQLPGQHTGELLTVLVVEDSEDFRAYLKKMLEPDYKVIEAADGREGWQKALFSHPHVIVSDISMPYLNGIELSNKVKADKRTSHIPVILLTALGDTYQLKGLKTGASDFLNKPFPSEILNVKIRNLALLNQRMKETYSRRLNVVAPPADVPSENEQLLLRITRYIEENLDNEKLSVEDLSQHLFMSRATLYNRIVELTGQTPIEFIRSIKLNKAAHLLEHSDMKVTQICYAVGFTTPNYFSKAFKAKFNLLPSEYAALKRKSRH